MNDDSDWKMSGARDRWLRIAPKRVDRVLQSLEVLKQCATDRYESEIMEEQHVLNTLQKSINDLQQKFADKHKPRPDKPKKPRKPRFSFSGVKLDLMQPAEGGSDNEY